MNEKLMIALIGEQQMPNLLPIRYEKPDQVILIYSKHTENRYQKLKNLLGNTYATPLKIEDPYNIFETKKDLSDLIYSMGYSSKDIIFNLTGGTKPMAFASYHLADELSSPFIYLQSEGGKSLIYRYEFIDKIAQLVDKKEIPPVITIDDYLRVHLGTYEKLSFRSNFEKILYEELKQLFDEVSHSIKHGSLEIDLVLRRGNQVGIVEVKTGKSAAKKEGIDQLNTAAEQRYLGTYARKFLIVNKEMGANNLELAKAHRTTVIELCKEESDAISVEDKEKLADAVFKNFGG